ncbi:hypothetical protein HOR19_gp05 [Phage MedPE-SWcel-C56]|uniref:Uncharacterized protein n=1 Tax=Phage MedPE-SWcel-C56 TaxID=1871314 RepID=A0A1B1IXZ1_9CAUD|nr:hypothetical protein HOR19_gp05 [Phage MedPE-SWcel-C56]ANS06198.1 hypothetical protein [Phage MedPE-SWcel-C56]
MTTFENELWAIQTTRPGNKRETLHVFGRHNMLVAVTRIEVGLMDRGDLDYSEVSESVTVKRV